MPATVRPRTPAAIDNRAYQAYLILRTGFISSEGVGVVLEAEHLCMSPRGVQATGARTVTSALHGRLRTDPRSRQEFPALTGIAT
jgi:GTP cyclohydrolase I